ncbi:hypothetical protein Btru_053458 [Bulinus truncatus]|nr:hypothetical protein Btru_053458 [Bulinus truncatus]
MEKGLRLALICCILDLTYVMVTHTLTNAALWKPSYQSTLYAMHDASRGNDGNNASQMGSGHCQHTDNELVPWWMVDLNGLYVVERIILTNRLEDSTRLSNFTIDVFTTDPRLMDRFPYVYGQVCYYQIPPLSSGTYYWTCSMPITGRFVRLVMFSVIPICLHMCEMEVLVSDAVIRESNFIIFQNKMYPTTPLVSLTTVDATVCTRVCLEK